MAKRSLYASKEGAKLARKIFDRRGWTQENLAAELDLRTRQPIWRFFTCRPIERHIFIEVCTILDLNWWEIAEQPPEPLLSSEKENESAERLVGTSRLIEQTRLKHQERIEQQCSALRVLGTSYPVKLGDLYVEPCLLSRHTGQEHIDIAHLEARYSNALSNLREYRLEESTSPVWQILEAQSKLRILGKPGSGKTTLLKWIALECHQGRFQPSLIPVFIKLGSYIEASAEKIELSLSQCIQQELLSSGISDSQAIETLLNEGKFLLLIDELDEVSNQNNAAGIFREICKFCERYHRNRIIVASRLSYQDFELPHFTDFELADFNNEQIVTLAEKWFSIFEKSAKPDALAKANKFVEQLNDLANQRTRELAGIPLFFNRICQFFQGKSNLLENRSRIYEECLSLALSEWDKKRGIQRSYIEPQPSLSDQIYILSQLATFGLKRGRYFFEQSELEHYIKASLSELQATGKQQKLPPQDEVVTQLRIAFLHQGILLEQAYGIFSFSHTAFQEYLVSKQIALSPNLEQSLERLLNYLAEPRWQEVFLLVGSKLQNRDLLLDRMRLEIQSWIAQKPDVEAFLNQLQQRSYQWLLYCQVAEVHTSFCQLIRTPQLLSYFATHLAYLNAFAQDLLLEAILAKLSLWLINPNWQNVSQTTVQRLLNQALILAVENCENLENSLLGLKEQLFQTQWEAMSADQQQAAQASWLASLSRTKDEYRNENGDLPFDIEHVHLLQRYFQAIQLFDQCQDQAKTKSKLIPIQSVEQATAAFSPIPFNQIGQEAKLNQLNLSLKQIDRVIELFLAHVTQPACEPLSKDYLTASVERLSSDRQPSLNF